jgi:hypothetical protein
MAGCSGLWQAASQSDETDEPQNEAAAVEPVAPAPDLKPSRETRDATPGEGEVSAVAEAAAASAAASASASVSPEPATVAPRPVPATPPPVAAKPPAESSAKVSPAAAEKPLTGQATPPLDLERLEKRLKETNAIGMFTKLALKNQVDDLLDKFRAFYQGRSSASPAQLRQPYEMLMMKVLVLLQDKDPPLARDILDSRDAIWSILADPEKFTSI